MLLQKWIAFQLLATKMLEVDTNKSSGQPASTTVSSSLPKLAEPAPPSTRKRTRPLDDLKMKIVDAVQKSLLDPDWEQVGNTCQLPAGKVRLYYNQSVTPMDHALLCLQQVDYVQVARVLDKAVTVCVQCHKRTFKVKKWDRLDYCVRCYQKDFQPLLESRWQQVNAYLIKQHKDACVLCNDASLYHNSGYYFHLDHVNMFEKAASVYEWVTNGSAISQVYQEVDKCQILCISCHAAVTLIERMSGFIRLKQNLTRKYNQTGELTASQDKSFLTYHEFMHATYEHIRNYISPPVVTAIAEFQNLID
jgi:hypothetical protein